MVLTPRSKSLGEATAHAKGATAYAVTPVEIGAADRIRTGDVQLGKPLASYPAPSRRFTPQYLSPPTGVADEAPLSRGVGTILGTGHRRFLTVEP